MMDAAAKGNNERKEAPNQESKMKKTNLCSYLYRSDFTMLADGAGK